jgi:glutaconate CoA-transferase subunit B
MTDINKNERGMKMVHLYTTREKYSRRQLDAMKKRYAPPVLVCCTGSREVEDRETVFVGIGISDLAGAIAKLVHTPNVILVAMAMCHQGLPDMFIDQQSGFIDISYLGFAQMDMFGNVNVSYIIGRQMKMNGSGGGGDIASSAGRIVYTAEFNPRQWVERVDYMTEAGFLDGSPDARKKENLVGGGPCAVVTDRGVFRFDHETHVLYLAEVFPWQDEADIEDVKNSIPWDLKVAEELKIIEPPTERELWALKLMDPLCQYIIANIMDRPIGKILAEGKLNIEGYDTFLQLAERAIQEVLESVT